MTMHVYPSLGTVGFKNGPLQGNTLQSSTQSTSEVDCIEPLSVFTGNAY